jgi:hypothetical protein
VTLEISEQDPIEKPELVKAGETSGC